MKLTTKSRYGTRALLDIALYCNIGSCTLKDISERQDVSPKYLDHILSTLKKAGFIKNIRGKNGGYSLSMPASMITLKDIVQTVEGSLAPVECVDKPEKCTRSYYCPTRDVWSELKVTIENTLEAKTLQNLIDSHNQKLQPQFNYSI